MSAPHKYADVIKAWADGVTPQYRCLRMSQDWRDCTEAFGAFVPAFSDPSYEWRVKPHKWQTEKDAWAEGKVIQVRGGMERSWHDIDKGKGGIPMWLTTEGWEYRVKPVPHKWQREIDAQWEGKVVQARDPGGVWCSGNWDFTSDSLEYRIKPDGVASRRCLIKDIYGQHYVHVLTRDVKPGSKPGHREPATVKTFEEFNGFVRWIDTEWQEVEV